MILLLLTAGLLTVMGSTQVVSAQQRGEMQQRGEILPIKEGIPMYPSRAASRGIEGWVIVEFTVTEAGDVDMDTAVVADEEPVGMFGRSSLNALAEFKFNPQMENGQAVAVPGVQYKFNFAMSQ